MGENELPVLSLEEAKKMFLKYANAGDIEKAVKVAIYYEMSKPDFADKIDEAIMKAVKEKVTADEI